MFKGPKAILSSAIANALAEYFEVDANQIQSNLLGDANIVLHAVELKEQITYVPQNSAGNETVIRVTGCVEEVAFSWAWSVGQQKNEASAAAESWVKDAVLTIKGAKFVAKLEHGKKSGVASNPTTTTDGGIDTNEAFVDPATIDTESAKAIKKEAGGLAGYVQNQVRMIIDMLKLRIVGFELNVFLPPPEGGSDDSNDGRTIKIGGDEVELLSLGRQEEEEGGAPVLRQRLSINSFFSIIVCGERESVPFIEPFSYSAEATRHGAERFGSFATGLEVAGMQNDAAHDAFVLHAGTVQIETLVQLGVLLLAPPDQMGDPNKTEAVTETAATSESPSHGNALASSSFTFPLASMSLIILEENRIVASDLSMTYKANGTVCNGRVNRLQYESSSGRNAEATGIELNMRPSIQCTIHSIESFYIPDSFLLSKPIASTKVMYQGQTLSLVVDSIDAVLFDGDGEKEVDTDITETSMETKRPVAPCPMHMSVQNIHLKQASDGTSISLASMNLWLNPRGENRTQVAVQFDDLNSHLLQLSKVNMCATLPPSPNVIESFSFAGERVVVSAGHSTDDWQRPARRIRTNITKSTPPASSVESLHLPNANIGRLNVTITWGSATMKVKETTLGIKAFEGNESTKAKDLVNYYTKACLSKVPNFISNAEVLGISLADSTAVTYGTWIGIASLGAGGGVAAIAGVDAVKGAVAAGKRSRKADEIEGWRPGDFLRGIIYSAEEATREGAIKRGKSHGKGNVIDWAVGAADGTTEYACENKSRLGGAAGGGGGFLIGLALGGPIGGGIGGVVAGATTRKAIESFEAKEDRSRQI